MRTDCCNWIRALPCVVLLASCAPPTVAILERPLPGSPAAERSTFERQSHEVLRRDGLSGLWRRDPAAALRGLDRRYREEGGEDRLVALAELCGSLGDRWLSEDPGAAAGCYLDAARLALPAAARMAASGPERELRLIYNDSCAELTCLLQAQGHDWSRAARIEGPLASHELAPGPTGAGLVRARSFDELFAANRIGLKHAEIARRRQDGVGGALVARRPPERIGGSEADFVGPAGLVLPVNATIEFAGPGSRARVALHDLNETNQTTLGGRLVPLAADWTAALAYLYQYAPTSKTGFEAMLRPVEFDSQTNLFELTPYRRDKIPLVFVHGLMSTPETWIKMVAALGSDPVLRKNYQPLVFRYPSGYTIVRNSAALRSKLADYRAMAEARGGGAELHRMVLVGHSMGGIISNLQIRSSGDRIQALYLERPVGQLDIPPESRKKLREVLVFEPDPAVERAIFIAAPHRGSEMASSSIGALGTRLIHLPTDIFNAGLSLVQLEGMPELTPIGQQVAQAGPNSINSLRPDSEFLAAVLELPVAPRVNYHTIAGQANQDKPVAEGTDKVVPYWSSHLDGAASEKIVDASHLTITKSISAIEEVRRLLYLHLGLPAPEPLPPVTVGPQASRRVHGHPAR